jgi:hypothetical protein
MIFSCSASINHFKSKNKYDFLIEVNRRNDFKDERKRKKLAMSDISIGRGRC